MTAQDDEHEGRPAAPGRQTGGTWEEDTLAPPPTNEALSDDDTAGGDTAPSRAHPERPTTPSP